MLFDRFTNPADSLDAAEGNSPLAAGTTQQASAGTVIVYPYTGDYRVDVLLDSEPGNLGVSSRWNYGSALGTGTTVTYSFMTSVPVYGGNEAISGVFGFNAFTAQQKQVTREIFAHLTAELGINFTEVADSGNSYGQIRLGQNNQDNASTAGYTWLPNSDNDGTQGLGLSGDVWIDYTYGPNFDLGVGGEGRETLVHEIGHALGLKHPGDYNAGDSSASVPGNYLGAAEDNTNYTVMSYTYEPQPRDWYGIYDLLALKALYGADSSYNAGGTTYAYTDADGKVLKIIDDASGTDTIDLTALTLPATIDLRAGSFSSVGRDFFGGAAVDNLSIDLLTHIENVVGTNYNDHIILASGTGSANGNNGIDTVQYMSTRAAFTVTPSGTSNLHVTGAGMDDSLLNVERLQFTDGKYAFDFNGNGHAGQTVKILGAIFHQGATPDPLYAAAGLSYFDLGVSYTDMMQASINIALGTNHTHAAFVNLVYTNVAGFAPSPTDLNFWVNELNAGHYTEASLAILAADTSYNLAQVNFTGQASHGLLYDASPSGVDNPNA